MSYVSSRATLGQSLTVLNHNQCDLMYSIEITRGRYSFHLEALAFLATIVLSDQVKHGQLHTEESIDTLVCLILCDSTTVIVYIDKETNQI